MLYFIQFLGFEHFKLVHTFLDLEILTFTMSVIFY